MIPRMIPLHTVLIFKFGVYSQSKSKKEQERELKAVPGQVANVAKKSSKTIKDVLKKGKKIFGKGAPRKGRFAKGSQEAKDYMASLREMRGKK